MRTRYGSSSTTPIDNLLMSYAGNRLSYAGNQAFSYDSCRNLTYDPVRGLNFAYNILDKPSAISSGTETASYKFLADGTKALAGTRAY